MRSPAQALCPPEIPSALKTLKLSVGAARLGSPYAVSAFPLPIALWSRLQTRAELQAETAALHHQLVVLKRDSPRRPRLRPTDRFFWT